MNDVIEFYFKDKPVHWDYIRAKMRLNSHRDSWIGSKNGIKFCKWLLKQQRGDKKIRKQCLKNIADQQEIMRIVEHKAEGIKSFLKIKESEHNYLGNGYYDRRLEKPKKDNYENSL